MSGPPERGVVEHCVGEVGSGQVRQVQLGAGEVTPREIHAGKRGTVRGQGRKCFESGEVYGYAYQAGTCEVEAGPVHAQALRRDLDGLDERGACRRRPPPLRARSEDGIGEVAAVEVGTGQVCAAEVGSGQSLARSRVGAGQSRLDQLSGVDLRRRQVRAREVAATEVKAAQVGAAQVGAAEVDVAIRVRGVRGTEIGPAQVRALRHGAVDLHAAELGPGQ